MKQQCMTRGKYERLDFGPYCSMTGESNRVLLFLIFFFPLGEYATPMREIKESGNMGNQGISCFCGVVKESSQRLTSGVILA